MIKKLNHVAKLRFKEETETAFKFHILNKSWNYWDFIISKEKGDKYNVRKILEVSEIALQGIYDKVILISD